MTFVGRVQRYFQRKNDCHQFFSDRGFMIRFGPWIEASFRKRPEDAWYFNKTVQNTVEDKPYSRCCWHQEYSWIASEQKYYVRGFWATKIFKHPLLVEDSSLKKLLEQNTLQLVQDRKICMFQALPSIPPFQGFTSSTDTLKLTFVQRFHKTAGGVYHQVGSWQLINSIDLPELWEQVGPEGNIFGENVREPSAESTKEVEAGTVNAEDSEEDWF
ncbi:uncharacterized protein LOC122502320 [Leptopilina heterotoma]|uniref:uncharacterized protein LOC122502320 n=1 Tax=Leptopilina heterotoma TaxID=63436 RepID=UPI001CA8F5BF|nr:uncharacterized protein LOC122502320 [Leptopilina heterotoma]